MILVSFVLLYLGIVKEYEPLLMVPIAFGMLLANLPLGGITDLPVETMRLIQDTSDLGNGEHLVQQVVTDAAGNVIQTVNYAAKTAAGGLLYYLNLGVKLGIYPPLIFLGIGSMTDFSPLIANPKSILLGGAAQLGIFGTYIGATLMGFAPNVAASIAIIGGADGPTAIFLTTRLAPDYLGPIAVAAYSYMALVPIIQPPIMRALTTKRERLIKMETLRIVSKREKIIFPILCTVLCALLLPSTVPLVGCLMLGNLMKESGVMDRLAKAANNELMNIITIFLGISVGSTTTAATFLNLETIKIIIMGLVAFSLGSAGGVLLGKLMNVIYGGNAINPLIGSAGVSAVPMAARVSQTVGQKEDPTNFLLMHAMGPNVAGVIGSAVAAGILLAVLG
ncbi:MAG TPA: sodium ion-translocating decarboxylase subunit beta [Candidatus Fimivivens faecavium]|nr:sodium ion-translocating decarboxylase subunit beta [Candidatus Fimivivens faecavium]